MVHVALYRRPSDKALLGFEASGHAGFAEAGEDVVCAAISALTEVTVIGLEMRLGLQPEVKVDEASGYLYCRLDPAELAGDLFLRSQDLLETLALGLIEIEGMYPDFLRVKEVAV